MFTYSNSKLYIVHGARTQLTLIAHDAKQTSEYEMPPSSNICSFPLSVKESLREIRIFTLLDTSQELAPALETMKWNQIILKRAALIVPFPSWLSLWLLLTHFSLVLSGQLQELF